MKTYDEMNAKIVGFLRTGGYASQYAAQRIEELEREVERLSPIVELAVAWRTAFIHGRDITDEGYSVTDEAAEDALYDAVLAYEAAKLEEEVT